MTLSLCGALVAGAGSALAQKAPDLSRAKRLIEQGKGEQAWQLLAPFEFRLAGEVKYDYLLGLAALESGRPARATLAFERVLAVDPNYAGARVDMGRAYYALGDYPRARAELEAVRHLHPPLAARLTIQRYLAAIDEHLNGPRLKVTGHLEGGLGYDSNVNAATAQTSVFVPLFGVNFTLLPSSVRQSAGFTALGGGLQASYPLRGGLSLLAGGDLLQRAYAGERSFDYRTTDLDAGFQYLGKKSSLRFTVGANRYDLDSAAYRRIQSANLQWRRQLDSSTQLVLFGQDARIRYIQEALTSYSSNLVVVGVGALRELDPATGSVVFASLFGGDDLATDGRIDGDRHLYGLRAGAQRALRANVQAYATLTWQKSVYGSENVVFATMRRDSEYDLALGLNWHLERAWSARPEFTWTRNDSNIAVDAYDRYQLVMTLRRDWR